MDCASPTRRLKPLDSVSMGCSTTPSRLRRSMAAAGCGHRLLAGETPRARHEFEKSPGGHFTVAWRPLREISDAAPCRQGIGNDVVPVDHRRARTRGQETRQHLHRGGFSGAVRPEKTEHFSGSDLETQIIYGDEAAIILAQPPGLDPQFIHPHPSQGACAVRLLPEFLAGTAQFQVCSFIVLSIAVSWPPPDATRTPGPACPHRN